MPRAEKRLSRSVPNPIDIEVGKRIRVYRQQAGLSQTVLGDALKLTFQQVQKYEKGVNRVEALIRTLTLPLNNSINATRIRLKSTYVHQIKFMYA